MQAGNRDVRLSSSDCVHALEMAVACLISYWLMTGGLALVVSRPDELLGGMWAAVATIFVFRDTQLDTLSAGIARLSATGVSFALCLPYLWLFPATPVGIAVLIALGTIVMTALRRRGDIITTAITTVVVMVVAAIDPHDAWQQPLLRLVDTVVGVGVGMACQWLGSILFRGWMRPSTP